MAWILGINAPLVVALDSTGGRGALDRRQRTAATLAALRALRVSHGQNGCSERSVRGARDADAPGPSLAHQPPMTSLVTMVPTVDQHVVSTKTDVQ